MPYAAETDSPSIEVSDFDWSGLIEAGITILVGLLVLAVARFVIARLVARAQKGYTMFSGRPLKWARPARAKVENQRRVQRADTIGALLRSAVTLTIGILTGIMALDAVGINIAPLLASVGVLGLALSFGAREMIQDAISGFFITIEDQYGIGDTIEVGDIVGTVQSVGIRITRLVDERGVIWYVRNGEIAKIGNRSQGRYVPAPVPAAVSADADSAGEPAGSAGSAGPAGSAAEAIPGSDTRKDIP